MTPDPITKGTAPVVFDRFETQRLPFPYFVAERVVDEQLADALLTFLEDDAEWRLHSTSFYEQYECDLLKQTLPAECAPLLAPDALAEIRDRTAELLDVELEEHTKITAHKLVPGQGIGIHNDAPHDGTETHRMVLQLNRGFVDANGGHLLFFNSSDPDDVHRIFRPLHNTAVGFAMSDDSYHAVSDVRAGDRFTLVFSFWQADYVYPQREEDLEDDAARDGDGLERLLRYLVNRLGAHNIDHSGHSLFAHLVGTYQILDRWQCPPHLCAAALFHSVYGTEGFQNAAVSLDERRQIRGLVGGRAEELVYLYCTCSQASIHHNVGRMEPFVLRRLVDGAEISIDEATFLELLTLDAANALEQLPRLRHDPDLLAADRQLYRRVLPLMPEGVAAEIVHSYDL